MSPIDAALGEVLMYQRLKPNWDGDGARVPSLERIKLACEFLRTIPQGFQIPCPMIASSGKIGFYWSFTPDYADVEFDSDEHASVLLVSFHPEREDRWFDQMLLAQFTHEWYRAHMSAFCGEEHGAQ